jgi:aminopeptidase N
MRPSNRDATSRRAWLSRIAASLALVLAGFGAALPQVRRPSAAPQVDIENYVVEATLEPEVHEVKGTCAITFRVLEATRVISLELSENLSVQKILDPTGTEVDFGQDETGPGTISVRFAKELPAASTTTVKIEFSGGFDKDRYSRLYTRDESSAYIGPEGSYLLYSAKWFPLNKFLVDRATGDVKVTVPLGMTVIGPGTQLPVVTQGITERFAWSARTPILPNSIVVGRFFEKTVQSEGQTIQCFAREDHLGSIQKSAEVLAKILHFYSTKFGPSASGTKFRLVEVDDRLAVQHGNLGTVFVTHRELAGGTPAVRQLARRAAQQWWMETVGVQSRDDLWLSDGNAYFSAALYLGQAGGPNAFQEEIQALGVLGLKFESKSAVRVGVGLGYRSEPYESVVAGKGAWVFHMLRQLMGSSKFDELMHEYSRQFAGSGGSSAGFQKLAEKIHGRELGWFFAEWIDTIGVPEFQTDYVIFKTSDGFRVSGSIKQDRDLFRMPLEVAVLTKGKTEKGVVELNGKSTAFDIRTFTMPKQVVLDPENKVLRNSREAQVSVQLQLGNDLKQKGEFVEAIRAYEEALKSAPRRSLAHFRLAEVFYDQFNLQSAANSFRDALNGDKDPAWIEVWSYIYLGKIYDILGQRQRAMAEYNKAINTKDDTDGAQEEAKKWLAAPFTRERTTMEREKEAKPEPKLKTATPPEETPQKDDSKAPARPRLNRPPD